MHDRLVEDEEAQNSVDAQLVMTWIATLPNSQQLLTCERRQIDFTSRIVCSGLSLTREQLAGSLQSVSGGVEM